MVFGSCPDCSAEIAVGLEPYLGQQIACVHCGTMLQVLSTDPLTIDWSEDDFLIFEEDEDEDDPFDDEDERYEEQWRRARRQKAREDR